jgi:hypothetical protein
MITPNIKKNVNVTTDVNMVQPDDIINVIKQPD